MIIPECAIEEFDLCGYYVGKVHQYKKVIDELDEKIATASGGPLQYSVNSGQNQFSHMQHPLSGLLKTRDYYKAELLGAIQSLRNLGYWADVCDGDTGLTVLVPAF